MAATKQVNAQNQLNDRLCSLAVDLENKVGSGSTASVYLGRRSRDAQAINGEPDELVLQVLTPKPDAGGCDDEIEILRKEVDVLANVRGHPNINGFTVYVLSGSHH